MENIEFFFLNASNFKRYLGISNVVWFIALACPRVIFSSNIMNPYDIMDKAFDLRAEGQLVNDWKDVFATLSCLTTCCRHYYNCVNLSLLERQSVPLGRDKLVVEAQTNLNHGSKIILQVFPIVTYTIQHLLMSEIKLKTKRKNSLLIKDQSQEKKREREAERDLQGKRRHSLYAQLYPLAKKKRRNELQEKEEEEKEKERRRKEEEKKTREGRRRKG
eukprot:gnl/Carplike_NY0171/6813_a9377_210.p1 GENE.gnl/Carplike_NY0171/6813_a9377_210~~gnl/Carplike_NY0171/6813_a9377_210.p1  ORF type:complete len:218 (-),score=45.89 gnl/Carplike_NY0171/6813_a9377_210:18-671(-)